MSNVKLLLDGTYHTHCRHRAEAGDAARVEEVRREWCRGLVGVGVRRFLGRAAGAGRGAGLAAVTVGVGAGVGLEFGEAGG